jgi:hypothetical protein
MPTELQLVNRCLAELGRDNVSKITDSPDAIYVDNKINELFPEVIQDCNWDWAIAYREDSTPLPPDQNFSPDYTYTYLLPANYGKFFKWAATGAQWPTYEIVLPYMLAQTLPIQYYYITNSASYESMVPLTARLLVLYAAAKSALVLTNNAELAVYLENQYEKARVKAIVFNDMERSVQGTPYNDYDRITFI